MKIVETECSKVDCSVLQDGFTVENAHVLIRLVRNNAVHLVHMTPVMYTQLTSLIPHRC